MLISHVMLIQNKVQTTTILWTKIDNSSLYITTENDANIKFVNE